MSGGIDGIGPAGGFPCKRPGGAVAAVAGRANPGHRISPLYRLTIWDLKLGSTQAQMPDRLAFKGYACGSNGGPPLRKLTGWQDYAQCRADADGLYEVYFEYDDELEYILRAENDPRTVQYMSERPRRQFPDRSLSAV